MSTVRPETIAILRAAGVPLATSDPTKPASRIADFCIAPVYSPWTGSHAPPLTPEQQKANADAEAAAKAADEAEHAAETKAKAAEDAARAEARERERELEAHGAKIAAASQELNAFAEGYRAGRAKGG